MAEDIPERERPKIDDTIRCPQHCLSSRLATVAKTVNYPMQS